jgi:hypothetical protein
MMMRREKQHGSYYEYTGSLLGDLHDSHLSAAALDFLPHAAQTLSLILGRKKGSVAAASRAVLVSPGVRSVMSTPAAKPPLRSLSMMEQS